MVSFRSARKLNSCLVRAYIPYPLYPLEGTAGSYRCKNKFAIASRKLISILAVMIKQALREIIDLTAMKSA